MGNTCSTIPPRTTHTIVIREFHDYTQTPEYVLYKKLHPSIQTPQPRDILEALHLNTLCVRTTQTLAKGTHRLSAALGDGLVGIAMRTVLPPQGGDPTTDPTPSFYRLLADEHELVRGVPSSFSSPTPSSSSSPSPSPSSSSPLFLTPTTPSLLFYTSQAAETPDGLTILMETVPLYALQNTKVALELSDDAEVDFYTVYYPQTLLDATKNKKGKLQLQGHAWLYDPTAPTGEIAFFPDLPF
jgi:hypothetical protein